MKRLCPFEGYYLSSACRGTPFQLDVLGPLLPFAQGRPQLEPSFRLPPRQGAYRPAELGELNAATRRFIAPFLNSGFGGHKRPPKPRKRLWKKGGYTPSMCLRHIFTLSFYPTLQAGARRPSSSTPGNSCQTRKAGRSQHRQAGGHRAKGRTRPPNRANRTQPVHRWSRSRRTFRTS